MTATLRTKLAGRARGAFVPVCLALILALAGGGCATVPAREDDAWFGTDKACHFIAGGALSLSTVAAARQANRDDGTAFALGLGVVFTIGSGKEFHDTYVRKTYWSWRDMAWNLAGAMLGGTLVLMAD